MSRGIWVGWTAILVLILIIAMIAIPLVFGWCLWGLMAPVTFWQKFAMLIVECCVITSIFGLEVFVAKAIID